MVGGEFYLHSCKNLFEVVSYFSYYKNGYKNKTGGIVVDYSLIMNNINNSIKDIFSDYKGLYLYGSRAKNKENPSSDFDIILLTRNKLNAEMKGEIYKAIGRVEYELDIFIDIQLLTEDEISRNPFFYDEVIKYGKFYAA